MTKAPEFRELVGDEGTPEELERLRRVHELLVAAGPPPELPQSLAHAPRMGRRAIAFHAVRRPLRLVQRPRLGHTRRDERPIRPGRVRTPLRWMGRARPFCGALRRASAAEDLRRDPA